MKVEIDEQHQVSIKRLGRIGHFYRSADTYKFTYRGATWMQLSYNENTAILDAITKPLILLNITRRLTR